MKPDIWYQFESIASRTFELKLSSRMELWFALNNLRAVLFHSQPLLSGQLSKPFCAALMPTLHHICSSLYVCESYIPSIVGHC
jgi:hypothetical protein